jgi:hypothetical protein
MLTEVLGDLEVDYDYDEIVFLEGLFSLSLPRTSSVQYLDLMVLYEGAVRSNRTRPRSPSIDAAYESSSGSDDDFDPLMPVARGDDVTRFGSASSREWAGWDLSTDRPPAA